MSKFLNGNNRQVSIWPDWIEIILFVSSETIWMTSMDDLEAWSHGYSSIYKGFNSHF